MSVTLDAVSNSKETKKVFQRIPILIDVEETGKDKSTSLTSNKLSANAEGLKLSSEASPGSLKPLNEANLEGLKLLDEANLVSVRLLNQADGLFSYFSDEFKRELDVIGKFYAENEKELNARKCFLDSNYLLGFTRPLSYFNQLTILEKYEIASGLWHQRDLGRRKLSYYLFLALFKGVVFPSNVAKQHPYLLIVGGCLDDIATDISMRFPSMAVLRDMCKNCSAMSKGLLMNGETTSTEIDEGNLTAKCQEHLRRIRQVLAQY